MLGKARTQEKLGPSYSYYINISLFCARFSLFTVSSLISYVSMFNFILHVLMSKCCGLHSYTSFTFSMATLNGTWSLHSANTTISSGNSVLFLNPKTSEATYGSRKS